MMIYDKHYCNMYSGDEVKYKGNKYVIDVQYGGVSLSNDKEELHIKCNNGDVLDDIEIIIEPIEYENSIFDCLG